MFLKRVLSSIILSVLIFCIIYFASSIFFSLAVSILIFFALLEFYNLSSEHEIYIFKYFSCCLALFFPLGFAFGYADITGWFFLSFVIILLVLFLLEFTRKNGEYAVANISFSLFGIIYIGVPLSFFILIRHFDNGSIYIIYLILITKASDVGAYLLGKRFGKIRLIPRISPKKSLEGAIGGLLFSIITALIIGALNDIGLIHFLIIGTMIGVVAQIGDLSESLVKRYFNVKDSSNFIPGLGGILDLLDSLLFALPLFYFYIDLVVLR